MPRPNHTHVTIISPGNRAADVRSQGNARVPRTFAYGVDLVSTPHSATTARAWDGPLHDDAIEGAASQGATVYVRGVDVGSMREAIEDAGYERKPPEEGA